MTSSKRSAMFSSHLSSQPKDAFQRMSENIDAQNRLALESGTLPPEEEALIRESLFPAEVTYLKASNVGKSESLPVKTTRGEILAIPPDQDCGIEPDCCANYKAIETPRVKPSNLLKSLMERVE